MTRKLFSQAKVWCACFAIALCVSQQSQATVLVDYTGSVAQDLTFGAFDGNVTPTADGLNIVVAESVAPDSTFGGATTNASILAQPVITLADTLTIRAKLGPGANSSDFVIAFREASNEFFSYAVPASAFNTSTFEDFTVTDLSTFFFNGDVTGTGLSDGVPNDAVIEVSVQLPFGGTGAADIIVESISTSAVVPEPGTLALLGTSLVGLMGVRRRRA